MSELYEEDEAQVAFQKDVHERVSNNKEVSEYKDKHPIYRLLLDADMHGTTRHHHSIETCRKANELGLMSDDGHITEAGLEWLNTPPEL